MYCIKMKRSEPEFWKSSHRKIMTMIDMYADEINMKAAALEEDTYCSRYFFEEPETIDSMTKIEGWESE